MFCKTLIFDMNRAIQRDCNKPAEETFKGIPLCAIHLKRKQNQFRSKFDLTPEHLEDGTGIPKGEVVEVTEINSTLIASWKGIHLDVTIDELEAMNPV